MKWNDQDQPSESEPFSSIREKISSFVPNYNLTKAKEVIKQKYIELQSISFNFDMIHKMFNNEAKISWVVTIFVIVTPILGIYGILTTPFIWKTYLLAFIFYYIGGVGITAGYHRLWSHRSYDAHWTVQIFLLLLGSSTFEGSVFDVIDFSKNSGVMITDYIIDILTLKKIPITSQNLSGGLTWVGYSFGVQKIQVLLKRISVIVLY